MDTYWDSGKGLNNFFKEKGMHIVGLIGRFNLSPIV